MRLPDHKKSKTTSRIILPLFAFTLCACTTFRFPEDQKYRNYFPVKDHHIVTESELHSQGFAHERALTRDTNSAVQYVTPDDVRQLMDRMDTALLLILYYPNCTAAEGKLEIARFAEQHHLPYLLISDTYSPTRTRELNAANQLANRASYTLPTTIGGEKVLLKKRRDFIKELSPRLYDQYADQVIFITAMVVHRNKQAVTHPPNVAGFPRNELVIDWLRQQYRLAE